MTKEEYLQGIGLTVLKDGIIASLGKFEGEMVYAPYFYDQASFGEEISYFQDGAGEYVSLVAVDQEARELFPEIGADTAYMGVCESEQGFVSCTELTSERAELWRAECAKDAENREDSE